jgi:hypothetical protein
VEAGDCLSRRPPLEDSGQAGQVGQAGGPTDGTDTVTVDMVEAAHDDATGDCFPSGASGPASLANDARSPRVLGIGIAMTDGRCHSTLSCRSEPWMYSR